MPLDNTAHAILYRYLLAGTTILHAVRAELYQGSHLITKTKPIHTSALTDQVLKMYLQSVLEAFSQQVEVPILLFREMIDLPLDHHACPISNCHLNREASIEEFL